MWLTQSISSISKGYSIFRLLFYYLLNIALDFLLGYFLHVNLNLLSTVISNIFVTEDHFKSAIWVFASSCVVRSMWHLSWYAFIRLLENLFKELLRNINYTSWHLCYIITYNWSCGIMTIVLKKEVTKINVIHKWSLTLSIVGLQVKLPSSAVGYMSFRSLLFIMGKINSVFNAAKDSP